MMGDTAKSYHITISERDSTGTYHVVWVSRKAERHTGFWAGAGTVNQSSQTTAFVRHSEIGAVDGV